MFTSLQYVTKFYLTGLCCRNIVLPSQLLNLERVKELQPILNNYRDILYFKMFNRKYFTFIFYLCLKTFDFMLVIT